MSTMATFTLTFLLISVGWLLARRKIVPENAADTLNLIALYVFLPASILLNTPKLTWSPELSGLAVMPWLMVALGIVVALLAQRYWKLDRGVTACIMLGTTLGNTAFLGYSLIPALVGASGLRYAVVFDQFGTFIALASFGLFVIAWYGGGDRPTAWGIARRVLVFPPFIALMVAFTVMPAEPPVGVARALEILAAALMPCVVIAVGTQLRFQLPREQVAPLVLIIGFKLVLMPAFAWLVAPQFGVSGELREVMIYQAGMPTMITTGALLSLAGLAPQLAAAMVGYTTLLSIATLPLWQWLATSAA